MTELTSKCPLCHNEGKALVRPDAQFHGVFFKSSFYTCQIKECSYSWVTPLQIVDHLKNLQMELVRERDYFKGIVMIRDETRAR